MASAQQPTSDKPVSRIHSESSSAGNNRPSGSAQEAKRPGAQGPKGPASSSLKPNSARPGANGKPQTKPPNNQARKDGRGQRGRYRGKDKPSQEMSLRALWTEIKQLEMPSSDHLTSLSKYLLDLYTRNVITHEQLERRFSIYNEFKEKFEAKYPNAEVNMYGSVLTGICQNSNECDIEVHFNEGARNANISSREAVGLICDLLSAEMSHVFDANEITENRTSQSSRIKLAHKMPASESKTETILFNFTSGVFTNAYKTSILLRAYMELDERAKVLAFALRHLASMFRIDRGETATLPPHSYSIMVVYFLQTLKKPILPVLHEVLEYKTTEDGVDFGSFLTSLDSYLKLARSKPAELSDDYESVGSLWTKMLAFYSLDSGLDKTLICIRNSRKVLKSEFGIRTRDISIEDPFLFKQNLAKVLNNKTNNYILNVLGNACLYFARESKLAEATSKDKEHVKSAEVETKSETVKLVEILQENMGKLEIGGDIQAESVDESSQSGLNEDTLEEADPESYDDGLEEDEEEEEEIEGEDESLSDSETEEEDAAEAATPKPVERVVRENLLLQQAASTMLDPEFVKRNAGSAKSTSSFSLRILLAKLPKVPPLVCKYCKADGHLKDDCPNFILPTLKSLPELTSDWVKLLDSVCNRIAEKNSQSVEEKKERTKLLEIIRKIIARKYPDAILSLFGSSNNGFSMRNSDMDICMRLDETTNHEEINFKRVIRHIGGLLRQDRDFNMIEERLSAKVPIVKFRNKTSNIEGDISLYNTLALHNTDLLRTYTEIDERTRVLGIMIKYYAKTCSIGDASCGSLSSYAYTIMMLHYLMNIQPPVLPCLQMLNREHASECEAVTVNNWDCWFYKDLASLPKVWPHYRTNTQSIGELWLGFFRYYTEIFNWNENVVCIRLAEPLTKKAKKWNKKICIEDPFELSHNLGAGVSFKMGLFILTSFVKARYLFGNVQSNLILAHTKQNADYFFNPDNLVEGQPPLDRCCFICKRIGHQASKCPKANTREVAARPQNKRQDSDAQNQNSARLIKCYKCQGVGHIARDCKLEKPPTQHVAQASRPVQQPRGAPKPPNERPPQKNGYHIICFKCKLPGHEQRACPQNNNQGSKAPAQNAPRQPYHQNYYAPPIHKEPPPTQQIALGKSLQFTNSNFKGLNLNMDAVKPLVVPNQRANLASLGSAPAAKNN